jgi:hypothetical protein
MVASIVRVCRYRPVVGPAYYLVRPDTTAWGRRRRAILRTSARSPAEPDGCAIGGGSDIRNHQGLGDVRTHMMSALVRGSRLRLLALVVVCISLLCGAVLWFVTVHHDGAQVVAESPQPGWKTIDYRGVRVDIPSTWDRTEMSGCEFGFEHWAPPDAADCGRDGGVAFYAAATFDPSHSPGIRRSEDSRGVTWGGYAYAGEFAVYVSDADREVVKRVLDSTG